MPTIAAQNDPLSIAIHKLNSEDRRIFYICLSGALRAFVSPEQLQIAITIAEDLVEDYKRPPQDAETFGAEVLP